MNIKKVLLNIGKTALKMHPAGAAVMSVVNAVAGKPVVTPEMSGEQVEAAIQSLPPEQQSQVMLAEIEADVDHDRLYTDRFAIINKGAGLGWVRPLIVLAMALLIWVATGGFLYILLEAVQAAADDEIGNVFREFGQSWMAIVAILSFPTWVVRVWFGYREQAKQRVAQVATEQPIAPMVGFLEQVKGLFK